MKLWADSDELVTVRWFRCPPGAQEIPYENHFGSRIWDYAPRESDLGEVDERPLAYDRGINTVGYTGRDFCGSAGAWEEGGDHALDPVIATDDQGAAPCCGRVAGVRLRPAARLRASLPHVAGLALRVRAAALQGGAPPGVFVGRARLVMRLAADFPPPPPAPSGPALVVVPRALAGGGIAHAGLPLVATLTTPQGPDAGVLDKRRRVKASLVFPQGPDSGVLDKRRRVIAQLRANYPAYGNPTFRTANIQNFTIVGSNYQFTISTTTAGDLLVFVAEWAHGSNLACNIPSGFTRLLDFQRANQQWGVVAYKIASGGEAPTLVIARGSSVNMNGGLWHVSSPGAAAPTAAASVGVSATASAPSSATPAGGWLHLVCYFSDQSFVGGTGPAGYTQDGTISPGHSYFRMYHVKSTGAGATGAKTQGVSAAFAKWAGYSIVAGPA